jgi:hypothetical protein
MIGHNGLEEGVKTKQTALVVAGDTEALIAELNTALDQLDERHTFQRWYRDRRCQPPGNTEEVVARAYAGRR